MNPRGSRSETVLPEIFSALFGLLLGYALIQFGNPVILDDPAVRHAQISNAFEPEPAGSLRYWLLGMVGVFGLATARWNKNLIRWIGLLPLIWLGWQFIAAGHTVDAALTRASVKHFVACVVCFYLGAFALSRGRNPIFFWLPLSACFLWVILFGFDQHFGGLRDTREYFYHYIYPKMREVPPEFLKKISSNRIFSTLFYPNTLAGAILLLLPGIIASIWYLSDRLSVALRGLLAGIVGLSALACLYWSGSKAGWLIALVMSMVLLFRTRCPTKIKILIAGVFLFGGLAGFFWKYADFFERGATSVGARFDYWRAAVQTAKSNPLLGTGPGTFYKSYQAIKKPESEMARLAHNDYLQQASDSGIIGFLLYVTWMAGTLWRTFAKNMLSQFEFFIWLGLLGWALQSFVEFGLYIPAISWPAFALMGWLWAKGNPIDKKSPEI